MRPFQEFRLWAKRAPAGERALTAVAAVIVLALVAWLLVPEDGDAGSELSAIGDTSTAGASPGGSTVDEGFDPSVGDDGATVDDDSADGPIVLPSSGGLGTDGAVTAGGGGGVTGGGGGDSGGGGDAGGGGSTPAASGEQGCQSPPGNAKGVSDTEVKVVVALTEIGVGGTSINTIFDVPSPEQAKADFEAAINGINKEGGVACRKLVAHYVNVNPADEQGMIQHCREFVGMDVFAVIDTGSMATRQSVLACIGQNKLPYFGAFYITDKLRQQFYPYIYSFYFKEQVYKNTAFALRDAGFFDPAKGFEKLGFIYRDCEKEAIGAFRNWIREAGVPDDKVVTYNLGCPSLFASEADMQQAALTFKAQGVTHEIGGNIQGDIARITFHNEQQGFRPKWGLPDEALLSIASGSRAPDPDNFNGAIAVTLSRDAEENTPGMSPTAGTQKCNAYRKAAGLPPVWEVPANAGHACSQLWMLDCALSNAPRIERGGPPLQAGLMALKGLDFSYPQGVADFTAPGTTTGGQHFRMAQFTTECNCWRVIQREFRRGY